MKTCFKKIISFLLLLSFTFCTINVFANTATFSLKKNLCVSPLKLNPNDLSMYAELEEEDDDSDGDTEVSFSNLLFEITFHSRDFILWSFFNENSFLRFQRTLPIYISTHVFRI